MLPERNIIDRLIAMRRREWQKIAADSRRDIADFLLDVGECYGFTSTK